MTRDRCRNGHLIAEVGRNSTGHCNACAREYARRYYAAHAERLRPQHAENSRLDRAEARRWRINETEDSRFYVASGQ